MNFISPLTQLLYFIGANRKPGYREKKQRSGFAERHVSSVFGGAERTKLKYRKRCLDEFRNRVLQMLEELPGKESQAAKESSKDINVLISAEHKNVMHRSISVKGTLYSMNCSAMIRCARIRHGHNDWQLAFRLTNQEHTAM